MPAIFAKPIVRLGLVLVFCVGAVLAYLWWHGQVFDAGKLAQHNQDIADQAVIDGQRQVALIEANLKAARAEAAGRATAALAATNYEQGKEDARKESDSRIASLNAGTVLLRVQLAEARTSANRGAMPDAGPGAGSGDDPLVGTLAPAVAGRLGRRYEDFNAVVRQLAYAQSVIENDRRVCGVNGG